MEGEFKWYALKVVSGQERIVKKNFETEATAREARYTSIDTLGESIQDTSKEEANKRT